MLDENMDLNEEQADLESNEKSEMDNRIALKIYKALKIIRDELNATEIFAGKGTGESDWSYNCIKRKDVWNEKTDTSFKTVHKFSLDSKYRIYFIILGYAKNVPPYIEINKDNVILFKAEVDQVNVKFDIKIANYNLDDAWYKDLINHFYSFGIEAENRNL